MEFKEMGVDASEQSAQKSSAVSKLKGALTGPTARAAMDRAQRVAAATNAKIEAFARKALSFAELGFDKTLSSIDAKTGSNARLAKFRPLAVVCLAWVVGIAIFDLASAGGSVRAVVLPLAPAIVYAALKGLSKVAAKFSR